MFAARALGNMNPALELAALLSARSSIAFVAHGAPATTRLAIVDACREPVRRWGRQRGWRRHIAVLGSIWIIWIHSDSGHMLGLISNFMALVVWLVPRIFHVVPNVAVRRCAETSCEE